ncbi:hypothetical protein PIB30_027162 [Stylosanthes scabra]|uniref:Uncharacterized protein n=1 Tax=Stylosanthes scabra TaxID=79078 RepID=A0ABU6Z7E3_9FABA|nr:hypothetical protein [Stylosanthes scabra]
MIKFCTSHDHGVSLLVRIALLPDSSSELEDVLDRYNTCYPVSGDALFTKPYCVEYKGKKRGFMLAVSRSCSCDLIDVAGLCSSEITTISAYYYGKFIAREARLALIVEEIGFLEVIPAVKKFLHETIQPWLDGTFDDNGFL